jgi:recombination protein RecA
MSTVPVELPVTKAQKEQAAEIAAKNIETKYGKGSLFSLARRTNYVMPHISTGIYGLDYNVLGIGGAPKGRILEFYGPESSGKTTLALRIVGAAQAEGGLAAYVDVENALDPVWATKNTVDTKSLVVSQPDNGEEALDIVEMLIESGAYSVIVVDSVAALVPRAELEGEFGDSLPGLQARLMSQAMRKLSTKVSKSQAVLIFINQIREKIGVMFGSPETTSGGRALKFFASVRLDIRKADKIKEGEEIVGHIMKVKAVKNKVGTPYKETFVDLLFKSGIDTTGNLIDCAVEAGVIEKSGAWFSYKGERLGQGKANSKEELNKNEALKSNIIKDLKENMVKV